MSPHPPGAAPQSAILTFLIADIRGYTSFTRSAGDEAAARLASAFAEIAREGVESFGGRVIELRGDEALAVFASPRGAIRAAVELQQVFGDEVALRPAIPLRVGIGLDAGEAVAVEDGFRGAALNVAARLCAVAAAGEVLASAGVVHLAGSTDDLEVRPRSALELKGLGSTVEAFALSPRTGDEARRLMDHDGDVEQEVPPELDAMTPIVGRDEDVRALRWAWRLSRRAAQFRVLIGGKPGVGKTRLAAEAAALAAADGYPVLYASAAWDDATLDAAVSEASKPRGAALVVVDDLDAAPDVARRALAAVGAARTGRPGLILLVAADDYPVDVARAIRRLGGIEQTIRLGPLDDAAVAGIFRMYGAEGSGERALAAMAQASDRLPGHLHALGAEWAREEAARRLGGATTRAAAGRRDLRRYEAEVASNLVDLQLARERTLAVSGDGGGTSPGGSCPFMGLAAFDVGDSSLFFGRERLVADMVSRLAGATFLGVVGPSGSGKSSAVRAGLLAALATSALPGSETWIPVVIRPGTEPMRELDRAVYAAMDESLRRGLPPGADALDGVLAILPAGRSLLIVVDQFEEVFTAVADEATRKAFIDTLMRASGSGRAIVVIAVRADFYGRCAEHVTLAGALGANHLLVGPMTADEYRRSIEGPARRAGLRIEPGLSDQIVADVLDQPGGLPLLSTALVELWQGREGRTIRRARYEETGGVQGAVGRLAEAAYARLDELQQGIARAIFLRLVGGEDGAVVRRRASLAELDAPTNAEVRRTLDVLTDARLLTVGEGNVEVAHEALLREWPRLAEWIEEDRESRRLRGRLAESSREWVTAGRDSGELYRGARLAAALDWSAGHTLELNELEREFVTESRALSEREAQRQARSNRRLRLLLTATAAGLVVALVAGAAAFIQRNAADRATADANAQKGKAEAAAIRADAQRLGALALATKDLDLSLLLARQGVALNDSPTTRADLLADLARSPGAIRILRPLPGRLLNVFASADGRTLVVDNNAGAFAVIDGATGQTRYTRGTPNNGLFGAAMSDGNVWEDTGAEPVTIAILNGQTGAQVRTYTSPIAKLGSYGLTPDAGLFAAVPADGGSFSVFDTRTGRRVQRVAEPSGRMIFNINGFAGGHWLVSATSRRAGGGPVFGGPGTLDWWASTGTQPLLSVPVADVTAPYSISLDGRKLAIDNDPEVGRETVVDLRSGRTLTLRGQHTGIIIGSSFSPDGSTLVTGGDDRVARVWDVKSGELIDTLEGHNGRVLGPAVVRIGGNLTAWTVSLDGSMMAWDLSGTRRLGQSFQAGTGDDAIAPIFDPGAAVAASPDGRRLIVGENDGAVVLDGSTHAVIRRITHASTDFPTVVAWSPDGSRVALTGDGADAVELYDTTTWRSVRGRLSGPAIDRPAQNGEPHVGPTAGREPNAARAIVFSSDSTRVVAGLDDGTIWTWDARTGDSIGQPLRLNGPIFGLAIRPDGALAAAFNEFGAPGSQTINGKAAMFDPGATAPRFMVDVDGTYGHADAVAFSPNGTLLATGGGTGDVRFWDAATGHAEGSHVLANAGWVLSIAWSKNGAQIVTGGTDGTVRLLDVATRSLAGTLPGYSNRPVNAILLPDGRHVVGAYDDGSALEWSIDPAMWEAAACSIAGRMLTRDEWTLYVPSEPYRPACAS